MGLGQFALHLFDHFLDAVFSLNDLSPGLVHLNLVRFHILLLSSNRELQVFNLSLKGLQLRGCGLFMLHFQRFDLGDLVVHHVKDVLVTPRSVEHSVVELVRVFLNLG